jgi:hypothetical protein
MAYEIGVSEGEPHRPRRQKLVRQMNRHGNDSVRRTAIRYIISESSDERSSRSCFNPLQGPRLRVADMT